MRRFIFILIIQLYSISLMSQEWMVPEDKKGKLSPFAFNDATRKAGERLYTTNCMSCHGTPGKGNFITLIPPSGDPATEKIQRNSDGEIFYKITTGRGPMPSFKNAFSTDDIWNLISYLRSFNTKYVQAVMPVIKSAKYPGAVISIAVMLNETKDKILMKVTATGDKSIVPVKDAGVKLFIKRTFGMLPLDEEKITDSEGVASFIIPPGIPGDTTGNLFLSAHFVDEDLFGTVSKDTVLKAGLLIVPESLVRNRAMWNNVRKAPLWVLFSYCLGVLGVWGFIFYVLFGLRDIFIIGKHLDKNPEKETPVTK